MMGKKGQVGIYVTLIFISVIIVILAAVFAPLGVLLNTELYAAGEDILLRANESVAAIGDSEVRGAVYDQIDEAFSAQQNNIDINADFFQYSWVLIVGLTALVVFIFTRRLVEVGGGGFI